MKQAKKLSVLLALTLVLSAFSVFFALPTSAAGWDGKPDIGWYLADPSKTEFTISTAADLLGLSYLTNASYETFRTEKLPEGKTDKLYADANGNLYLKGDTVPADAKSVDIPDHFTDVTVKLANDIDLENKAWMPIGSFDKGTFLGTLDGNNKTIKNISIDSKDVVIGTSTRKTVGFFGYMEGTVKNLTLDQVTIKVTTVAEGNTMVGGIAGSFHAPRIEHVTLNNLKVTFDDQSNKFNPRVGALVGYCNVETSAGYGVDNGAVLNNIHDVVFNGITVEGLGEGRGLSSGNKIVGSNGDAATRLEGFFFAKDCNNKSSLEYTAPADPPASSESETSKTPSGGSTSSPSTSDYLSLALAASILVGTALVVTKKNRH